MIPLLQATGPEAIASSAQGIAAYVPYVQVVCYAIAGVICIVGALVAYYRIHEGKDGKKAILITVGSAICFTAMAISLPSFFGIDSDGNITIPEASGGSSYGDGTSGMAKDSNGIPDSPIDASVPEVSNMKKEITGTTNGEKTKTITEASGYYSEKTYTSWNGSTYTYGSFDFSQLQNDYYDLTGDLPPVTDSDWYATDAVSCLNNAKGDWQKAMDDAYNNYLWAVDWFNSGETAPYGPSDYLQIYYTLDMMSTMMRDVMEQKYGNGEYSQQVRDAFNGL